MVPVALRDAIAGGTGGNVTGFLGVSAVVIVLFLGLARLSQGLVRDDSTADVAPGETSAGVAPGETSTDVVPGETSTDVAPGETSAEATAAETPTTGAAGDTDPLSSHGVGDVQTSSHETPRETTHETTEAQRTSGHLGEPRSDSPRMGPHSPRTGPHSPVGPGPESMDLSPGALLANVALTQGLFGALVAAAAIYFGVPLSAMGLDASLGVPQAVGVGLAFGAVLWLGNEAASAVADAAGAGYDERLRGMLAPDSTRGWLLLLGATLPIIAGVEELLFRAALIGVPAAVYGVSPWALAVVSSVAFALGHGAQGKTGIVVTGVLGLVLAAGFVLTGSLVVVVVAHYVVNALEFVVHEGLDMPDPFWS